MTTTRLRLSKNSNAHYIWFRSNSILNLGFQTKNFNLTYELPATLEVSFRRTIGSQIAVVHDGYLNEKQRFLLQTVVS